MTFETYSFIMNGFFENLSFLSSDFFVITEYELQNGGGSAHLNHSGSNLLSLFCPLAEANRLVSPLSICAVSHLYVA